MKMVIVFYVELTEVKVQSNQYYTLFLSNNNRLPLLLLFTSLKYIQISWFKDTFLLTI
jgi:hypothetical protein